MLALMLLAVMLLWSEGALAAFHQDSAADSPTTFDASGEGALSNSTFQPVDTEATEAVARGDLALLNIEEGSANESSLIAVFDAWQEALVVSAPGDAIPLLQEGVDARALWPDPDTSFHRRSEGVSWGIKRRLAQCDANTLSMWRSRFEASSKAALTRAVSDKDALARVEWEYPETIGGARAALCLADIALEAGAWDLCRSWLGRVQCVADDPVDVAIDAAVAMRRDVLRQTTSNTTTQEGWQNARVLELKSSHVISGTLQRRRESRKDRVGLTVESGIALLDDTSFLIQGPSAIVRWLPPELRPDGAPPIARFSHFDFLEKHINRPFAGQSSGGWSLTPATEDGRVVIVIGRALGTVISNALVAMRFQEPGIPMTEWRLSSTGWSVTGRADAPLAEVMGKTGIWEWQPGPLIRDGRVYVLARRVAGNTDAERESVGGGELWLFALDATDGRRIWSRYVTKPADLRRDLGGRFSGSLDLPSSGQPLTWVDSEDGGRLFVGTNVGLGELYDAVDGRLVWSFRCRRRDPEADGWPGSHPAPVSMGKSGPRLTWTPFDSDHLYSLRAEPDLGGGLMAGSPWPVGNAIALIVDTESDRLVQAQWGSRQTLMAWPTNSSRYASVHLGREESFTGRALASKGRVLLASDRFLYLFDRDRELELIDAWPLPAPEDTVQDSPPIGGSVHAFGKRVFVVGKDAFWIFEVVE